MLRRLLTSDFVCIRQSVTAMKKTISRITMAKPKGRSLQEGYPESGSWITNTDWQALPQEDLQEAPTVLRRCASSRG